MFKAAALHLALVAAGWGIAAALLPVPAPSPTAAGTTRTTTAPTKSERLRPSAELADGQRLLQRLRSREAGDPSDGSSAPASTPEQMLAVTLEEVGFDPAAPGPAFPDWGDDPEKAARADLYYQLVRATVEDLIDGSGGPDLAYAFRHRRKDAEGILADLATRLPGPASSDVLRCALHDLLALQDPARAAVLLKPFPEPKATGWKYMVARAHRTDITPDAFFALVETIPPPGDASASIPRQSAWLNVAPRFLESYGSDYFDWLGNLPAGADRDWAAVSLLVRIKDRDPADYNRIRDLIGDPKMRNGFRSR